MALSIPPWTQENTLNENQQGNADETPINSSSDLAPRVIAKPFVAPDPVREIASPFQKFDKEHIWGKDFAPTPEPLYPTLTDLQVEEEVVDPKGSSALESAVSSSSRETVVTELPNGSSASQEKNASAEKDNTPPKENEKSSSPIF